VRKIFCIYIVNFVQGLCALCGKKLTTEDTEEILHKGHKGGFVYVKGTELKMCRDEKFFASTLY